MVWGKNISAWYMTKAGNMLSKILRYSGTSSIHTSTKTSRGALSPGVWSVSTQSIPAPIPDSPKKIHKFCKMLSKNIVKNDILPVIDVGGIFMKKSSHSTGHIHDIAFKIAYYRTPRLIPDLLRLFCEDTTLSKLDMEKIRIETPSYIAGKKNLHCDLVVSAPFLSDPKRKSLFIIEHKSYLHKHALTQIDNYQHALRNSNVYNENDAIYILLFYHGKNGWNLPLTFYSSHGNAASESMTEGTVDVRVRVSYIVRDLRRMTKKQLALRSDGKRYTSTALWYIMRDNEMDAEGLKEIAQLLNGLSSQDFTDLAESVLGYLKDLGLYEQFEKIDRELFPRGENSMRTYNITNAFVREGIAKGRIEGLEQGITKGRAEGIEKGILKGRAEGHIEERRKNARSMFSKGFSAHDIQDVTGLSDEDLRTVRNGSQ